MRPRTVAKPFFDVYHNGVYQFTAQRYHIQKLLRLSLAKVNELIRKSENGKNDGIVILEIPETSGVIYSYYDGDELLAVGSDVEIAEELGMKPETIVTNASTNRSLERQSYCGRYAIPMDANEAERMHVQNIEMDGYRVFRVWEGNWGTIYRLFDKNGEIMLGSPSELAHYMGESKNVLYRMLRNPLPKDEYRVEVAVHRKERQIAVFNANRSLRAVGTEEELCKELGVSKHNISQLRLHAKTRKNWGYAFPIY